MKEESREHELASAFNIFFYVFCISFRFMFYVVMLGVLYPCIACVLCIFFFYFLGRDSRAVEFFRIYFNRIGYIAKS